MDQEYEINDARTGKPLYFHVACHSIWQRECQLRILRGETEQPPPEWSLQRRRAAKVMELRQNAAPGPGSLFRHRGGKPVIFRETIALARPRPHAAGRH